MVQQQECLKKHCRTKVQVDTAGSDNQVDPEIGPIKLLEKSTCIFNIILILLYYKAFLEVLFSFP